MPLWSSRPTTPWSSPLTYGRLIISSTRRHLTSFTNLPVTRFELWLKQTGRLDEYHQLLFESFNPATVDGLMCRDTMNVGWEGDLFDCDFNQMLDLPMGNMPRRYLWVVRPADLESVRIAVRRHCFGCTAGAGSSCGGTIS